MALSGVHIACGYASAKGLNGHPLALFNRVLWSETMSAPGTTAKGAVSYSDVDGSPIFEIRSSMDIYVAIGPAPDATTSPRIFVPANETWHVAAKDGGEKLAWIAA